MAQPSPPPPHPKAQRHELAQLPAEAAPAAGRRYDLDALRGFAMLLGIALHAAIPFVPYWQEGDSGGGILIGLFEFIHGFRMPLFFILSGYFTTMLWRHRGLRALLIHRLRRIGLPLVVGVVTILPAVVIAIILGYVISAAGDTRSTHEAAATYNEDINRGGGQRLVEDPALKAQPEAEDKPESDQDLGFAHMWFLWFLLWLVAGFAPIAGFVGWLAIKRRRERPVPSSVATLALVALPLLAVLPQAAMSERFFGPDTSETLLPNRIVLAYYACFFAFGALAYDRRNGKKHELLDRLGQGWPAQLLIAALVLFPVGRTLIDSAWFASAVLQVAFAWTLSFGLIGLFHRYLSTPRFRVRWLSDASYWMYLAHLPLVFVAQGIAVHLPLNALINFALICAAVTMLTMLSYRYLVRYTPIGTLLNGIRTRIADDALRVALGPADQPEA